MHLTGTAAVLLWDRNNEECRSKTSVIKQYVPEVFIHSGNRPLIGLIGLIRADQKNQDDQSNQWSISIIVRIMATQPIPDTTPSPWVTRFETLTAVATFPAVAVFVADYGFELTSPQQLWVTLSYGMLAALYVAASAVRLTFRQEGWKPHLRAHAFTYLMSALMLAGFLGIFVSWSVGAPDVSAAYTVLLKVYLLPNIWHRFIGFSQRLAQYNASPARFIVISFGSAILIGAGLLLLPKATTVPLHPLDALFTATSAICVTGLIVVDTATAFTRTGQLIILGLIQLGGLGIMTVTAFFSLLIGQRMSGREQVLLGNVLSTDRPAQLGVLLRTVFLTTISIEACGALLLFLRWRHAFSPAEAWYSAIFHAISAFCNAGFSTFSKSLVDYASSTPINLTICALIIFGGLGFRTLRDLKSLFSKGSFRQRLGRISVQSKVIITVTCLLFGAGMLVFFLLESPRLLHDAPLKDRVLVSLFQSVTCRTAGFNTVDFADLHPATMMLSIILMFIGAAPGSTGGGLKVTTVAILIGTVIAAARGRTRLDFFRRTIPVKVLYQTLVVITVYLFVAVLVSFLLSITEHELITNQASTELHLIFESISALGTVGLSTGVTSRLTPAGRVIVIMTMFLGRIGPFTLALAIGQRQFRENYHYPEEEVQIG